MSLLEQLFVNSCRNEGSTLSLLPTAVAMQEPLKSIIQKYSPPKIKTSVSSSPQRASPYKLQNRMLTMQRQRELKYSAITTLKRYHRSRVILQRKKQRIIIIPSLKSIKPILRQQQPMPSLFLDKQQLTTKISIIVPQRAQVQNFDYSYNAGIFLIDQQQREELFRIHEMNNCTGSELSFSKDRFGTTKNSTFNQEQAIMTPLCRQEKRVSTDTVFSDVISEESYHLLEERGKVYPHNFAKGKEACVVDRIEDCLLVNPSTREFFEQSQNECLFQREEELAVIESEGQITNSWSSFKNMNNLKGCFYNRAIDEQIELTKRQLDALITCRKQKEERRYSTLQQIVKSKQIIQQLVAELNQINEPKSKLVSKRIFKKGEKQSYSENKQKFIKTATKSSISSLEDMDSPQIYNSLRKISPKVSVSKSVRGRRQKTHQSQIIKQLTGEEEEVVPHTQRTINIYSQYVKGKKKMELGSTSKSKPTGYKCTNGKVLQREQGSGKKGNIQNILLNLSRFPPCTERRIDLKIDLVKQNRNVNHLQIDRTKRIPSQAVSVKIKLGRK